MRVALTEEFMTVGEAPIGLLMLEDGTVILKTEYRMSNEDPRCMCFIVSSGEYYHGEGDKALCQAMGLL